MPKLADTVQADVVVVGAGITGLSAALHLAEAGCRVAVVDAREAGWGGSGRAFGQVVPYLKRDEAQLVAAFGPDWGQRTIGGVAGGPDYVAGLIDRHGIECDVERHGLLFAAHAPKAEAALARRARFWADRGAPVRIVEGSELQAMTGTAYYRAALLEGRGFCLNPLAYARGLARAMLARGGALYENSPARTLTRQGGAWRLGTDAGAVVAAQVILATDAYSGALWPGLSRSILPLRAYQLVSAPLTDNLRRTVLPGGQAITDTRRLYSGVRLRRDGRLHLSVHGPALSNAGNPDTGWATRRVNALFPHLPPPVWESAVAGWVGMTVDHVPHIHRLAPGLLAAAGLNGRGIAMGTLLGREASLRVLDRPQSEWMMPDTPLRPLRVKPFARPLLTALLAKAAIQDSIELWSARATRPAGG